MSEAQRLALALMGRMNEVAHAGRPMPAGLALFGVGQSDVMSGLARLEPTTRRTVRSLLPNLSFDPEDPGYELNPRSTGRGIELQGITSVRALRLNPLYSSFSPWIRVGPVSVRMILVDDRLAVLEGPDTPAGETTAWLATSGDLLDQARELWAATWSESRPVLEPGAPPPLNARQLDVARRVCLGKTDAAIARQLGISERTVARDVAIILEVTGAHSRSESILNMLGRGRQSRT